MRGASRRRSNSGRLSVGKQGDRREHPSVPQLPQFDVLIHERMRLGIVSALSVNEVLSFGDLKRMIKTTDGNLSVHAHKLEEAGYLSCAKFFEGRLPKTEYKLTSAGRQAFERYLRDMEGVIKAVRGK